MTHAFGSIDELGEGYGFRKVRRALGVDAFGVNAIVMPPRYEGVHHYHDEQDELYFVHSGTARVEVEGEERVLGPESEPNPQQSVIADSAKPAEKPQSLSSENEHPVVHRKVEDVAMQQEPQQITSSLPVKRGHGGALPQ